MKKKKDESSEEREEWVDGWREGDKKEGIDLCKKKNIEKWQSLT